MERSDLLLTTAQLGMALAGFAGLVTLLGRPHPRADQRLSEIRFRSMMELSLTLAAFGLLPFVPAELGLAERLAWRLASAAYALACTLFLLHSLRRNRRAMGRVLVAGGVTATLFGVGAGLALVLALAALGACAGRESAVYCAALFVQFLAASFFFIRLLYGALPEAPTR